MKTIALDVHTERTQISVSEPGGEIVMECIVDTHGDQLRKHIARIPGPKRVVFENGPLSGLIMESIGNVAEEVIACDPTRNHLIATADDSNDLRDARRLGLLARSGGLHAVYVPKEPFRTLRSLVVHEACITNLTINWMMRIKALLRKYGVRYQGRGVYRKENRAAVLQDLPTAGARFQAESAYRILDYIRTERVAVRKQIRRMTRAMPLFHRIQTVPGIGPIVAWTLIAWIVDPGRFKSRSALCAYAGIGLRGNFTNWKQQGNAHASRRGQRAVKRVLFLAARAAIRRQNAFSRRYQRRIECGWQDRKAIRDTARTLLLATIHVWRTGESYCDGRINTP